MINVTKTYLPSKEKYQKYIDEIYANKKNLNRPDKFLDYEKWKEVTLLFQ